MPEPKISIEEVRHVAWLARLELNEEEVDRLRADLDVILDHMAELEAIDVTEVEPAFHVPGLTARLRADEPITSLSRETALEAAPSVEEGAFVVPRTVRDEP